MKILNDFQTSVRKALFEIYPFYDELNALVVCGSHSPKKIKINEILEEIKVARESGTPALLICSGYQLAAIEYARNVLHIKDATSEEFSKRGTFVVRKRHRLKVGLQEGHTWWSLYDVTDEMLQQWNIPENWVAIPFHPEYQSSKRRPSRLLIKFINLCGRYE